MFKDCKTGGYNLEKSHANNERLKNLIFLIALAYTCAIFQGQRIKRMGIKKYVGRLTESKRRERRHSSFWIGLYGQSWVVGMEFCQEIIAELMRIRRNKLPFFQRGLRAMQVLIRYCAEELGTDPISKETQCVPRVCIRLIRKSEKLTLK